MAASTRACVALLACWAQEESLGGSRIVSNKIVICFPASTHAPTWCGIYLPRRFAAPDQSAEKYRGCALLAEPLGANVPAPVEGLGAWVQEKEGLVRNGAGGLVVDEVEGFMQVSGMRRRIMVNEREGGKYG